MIMAGNRGGRKHAESGQPSEDAFGIYSLGSHTLIAIADGASDPQAPLSRDGARLAVEAVAAHANRSLSILGVTEQLLVEAFAAARIAILTEANAQKRHATAYSTTLAVIILAGTTVVGAQIGNSSLYTWDGRTLTQFCVAPITGTNQTHMLTDDDWRQHFVTAISDRPYIKAISMCTDGADALFLANNEKTQRPMPSAECLKTLTNYCDTYGSNGALYTAYGILTDQKWIKEFTDDATFVMAFKPQTKTATPHAGP